MAEPITIAIALCALFWTLIAWWALVEWRREKRDLSAQVESVGQACQNNIQALRRSNLETQAARDSERDYRAQLAEATREIGRYRSCACPACVRARVILLGCTRKGDGSGNA